MDWKMCAIEDLRRYKFIKVGIINSKERLAIINAGLKGSFLTSKKESSPKNPDFMNSIVEVNKLRQNISSAQNMTKLIERALASLTDEEREILDKCYMENNPKSTSILSKELGFSSRSLYRVRDEALAKFTLAMYGVNGT